MRTECTERPERTIHTCARAVWQLVSLVLQTRAMYESHTGANVADLLKRVAEEWHLNDVVLVTDNAANMVVAAQLGGLVHVR